MKDIVIGKEKEGSNWIAIGEALNLNGKNVKNETKLLYEDGNNYSISDLEEQFANMSNDNIGTAIDDIMTKYSFITEWFLSVSGGKVAKAGLTVAENGVERDVVVDKFIMDLMQDAQEKLLLSGLEGKI